MKNEIALRPSYWASNPKYDTDYVDNNARTKSLPIFKQIEIEANLTGQKATKL